MSSNQTEINKNIDRYKTIFLKIKNINIVRKCKLLLVKINKILINIINDNNDLLIDINSLLNDKLLLVSYTQIKTNFNLIELTYNCLILLINHHESFGNNYKCYTHLKNLIYRIFEIIKNINF